MAIRLWFREDELARFHAPLRIEFYRWDFNPATLFFLGKMSFANEFPFPLELMSSSFLFLFFFNDTYA